jgi:subtilisin family serine protease
LGIAQQSGAFRNGPKRGERAHVAVQNPAVLLSTLLLGVLLLVSSPGMLFPSAVASSQTADGDQNPSGSGIVTRLGPSWNELHWDWEGIADEEGFVSVIVSLPDDLSQDQWAVGQEVCYSHAMNGYSARVTIDQLNEALSSNPSLQVYPDLPVQAFLTESVAQVGADVLRTYSDGLGQPLTGEGIVVAVIDTGVDYTLDDLGGGIGPSFKVMGGYDFYNHDSDPMDDNGHGTHVAGVIAADGEEIKGVAPDAKILAYKTLGREGQGTMSDVIAAIDMAMDPNEDGDTSDRVDVISMSLGGAGEATDPVCLAVARAVEAGIVVVAAAGNDGPQMGTVASPGIAPDAITVGAVDDTGTLAAFSSRGAAPDFVIKPEISAPGVGIVSTVPYANCAMSSPTGYLAASGTSMATPHVSGGAALLLQMHPEWTPEQVKSALITSAKEIDESIWSAGAGEMWLPAAVETTLFPVPAVISCGLAGGEEMTSTLTNLGPYVTISSSSDDWYALSADGSTEFEDWLNQSSVSPSSLSLTSGSSSDITLEVPVPDIGKPEGYYDGHIHISYGSNELTMPFGFAVLSSLTVHVLDADGYEVFDPYGGVWAYSNPDGDIAMMIRGNSKPAPPASFFLASGEYGICAAGHQDIYYYDDPYMLSAVVNLDRLSSQEIWLSMSDAREFVLDLETEDGNAIYVQDLRMYFRHEGDTNVSFHLVGSDYSMIGEELFTLPHSRSVFVSDTTETVGISISGFSYTAQMWDFMDRNADHWYEYASGLSTDFYIEASADLQYLLAWEFDGIDQSTQLSLGLVEGQHSVYDTKYDIPGELADIWGDWGSHRSIGGDAAFYVRRDTDTSLNSFFSGMTRTSYVQGIFSELYFPGSIFGGYLEREFYNPDYDHLVKASTASSIYLPDRNFLTAQSSEEETQRLGAGPYYPSLRTENTDDLLVLFHPLLRDQSGAKVGGTTVPSLNLYKNSMFVGIYQLSEFLSRPDAVRQIALTGAGNYVAKVHYQPTAQLCNDIDLELGFTLPSSDPDPPEIISMEMPQRFTPGDSVGLTMTVADASALSAVEISWRADAESAWTLLPTTAPAEDTYHADIATSSATSRIDIDIKVTDSAGNFLRYTACNACLGEIPVIFELQAEDQGIGYRNADESVLLLGTLTDMSGSPLHPTGAVPLELTIDGEKVGMILDEYVSSDYHTHDGNIRFEWHFNPADLFSGPDETIEVQVDFDLGIYEPVTRTFTLVSAEYESSPPDISLIAPSPDSLIPIGTVIDLEITDEGDVSAEAFLDGVSIGQLAHPWDVSTEGWQDGTHILRVEATDDLSEETSASFTFEVDGTKPHVAITSPADGTVVPRGSTLTAEVNDEHLADVTLSLDGGTQNAFEYPYVIDMSDWDSGTHTVMVIATDMVGLSSQATSQFEISESAVVVNVLSPDDGAVIKPGVPIEFSVTGTGPFTCRWTTGATWTVAPEPYIVQTFGWTDGLYTITFNASNEFGDSYEVAADITIDGTPPTMSLVSPVEESFVTLADYIEVDIQDTNFECVTWTIWGETRTSPYADIAIPLANAPADGYFTVALTAWDAAGNQANCSFTFAMDSQPPVIRIDNVASHGAVAPDSTVEFSVEDVFLASVTWSLDNGEMSLSTAPHSVDLTGASLGWHVLTIVASDLAGNERWANESIYVDGTSPTVNILADDQVPSNSSAEIRAVVSDDFGVSTVFAHYENEDGSFSTVTMTNDGQTYVVLLDPELIRDGMTVYVEATDFSGNTAESERVTLELVIGSPVEDVPDDDEDEEEELTGGSLLSEIQGLMIIGLLLSTAIVILAVVTRNRRQRKATRRRPEPRKQPSAPARVAAPRKAQVRSSPRPVGRPIEKPTLMIDANGVVHCRPVKVSQDRIVGRPVGRNMARPTVRRPETTFAHTSVGRMKSK